MPGSDKWIRSIKDNPAGKVVADPEGNRWEWQSEDETAHQLKKLNNDELSIEKTDIRPSLKGATPQSGVAHKTAPTDKPKADPPGARPPKSGARDSGGGFNPYDSSGKPKRR
jgi:hypothetical protein